MLFRPFTIIGLAAIQLLYLVIPVLAASPAVRLIQAFPIPTWLENLAVRRNGSILITEVTKPRLYQLNPFAVSQTPEVVTELQGYTTLTGISETTPDAFVVAAGNFSLSNAQPVPGSWSIFSVDFGTYKHRNGHRWQDWNPSTSTPVISKILDIPQADFLNAIVYLGPKQDKLLIADSTLGVIFRVDLQTLAVDIAIDDPLMKLCGPDAFISVNGIKLFGNYLYFTNTFCRYIARIPIDANGSPTGPSSIVGYPVSLEYAFDDFALDSSGTAYVATGPQNAITEVLSNGQSFVLAGSENSTEIAGPTAVAFGRTAADKNTLYVSTNGGLGNPLNPTNNVGGQLLAIDL